MVKRYKKTEINKLVQILKNNGVISVPTDTVYGVCAKMDSQEAYQDLMLVKNRPATKVFPVMCADKKQIAEIAFVDKKAEKIIDKLMPGPITLILNKKPEIPKYVNNGKKEIAIRVASSEFLKDLIKKVGCPFFMSSANQSGEPVCNSLDEIEKACPNLDGIVEGEIIYNLASTIASCTANEIEILRDGPISIEQINEAIMH